MIRELLTSPIAYHVWQSTVFAALVALLALVLRNNPARVRYGVWFAASMKFLIPFAPLITLGSIVKWRAAPATVAAAIPSRIESVFQPAFGPVAVAQRRPESIFPAIAMLTAIWACGVAIVVARWLLQWRKIRNIARAAKPIGVEAGILVKACATRIEPGIFGVFRPVLLLPEGIMERLSEPELRAVIAHEMCHVRRRDNLLASMHALVEAIFWFHPLVWWIGSRLVEERERACDEGVVQGGGEARVYAESILRTCEFYLEAPAACVSGVTGGELKARIMRIVSSCAPRRLGYAKTALLGTAAALAIATPVVVGLMDAPRLEAQSPRESFEVASIKPASASEKGMFIQTPPGGRFVGTNISAKFLIRVAYDVQDFQITGSPAWVDSERFDIEAKSTTSGADDPAAMNEQQRQAREAQMRMRLQSLLADRFHLVLHREPKQMPVYALVVGKDGPKLSPVPSDKNQQSQPNLIMSIGKITGTGAKMDMLRRLLSTATGRPVLDETGLSGAYDFRLEWAPDPEQLHGFDLPPGAKLPASADTSGPSLFTAIQEQLGLKLESTKRPVEVLVIDRVEKPTAN